jgi:hypothetical protein
MKPLFIPYEPSIPKILGFLILWSLVAGILWVSEWVAGVFGGKENG